MKILLIQPPIRDFYQTSIRTQPIGQNRKKEAGAIKVYVEWSGFSKVGIED
jgi:hypothetical protein